ncbi:MAG TPA: hypothetical protein VFH45_13320 [Acidimicrobiales bacterium]|nr:hypothetical protein [Acidimicrobiales bacterium]
MVGDGAGTRTGTAAVVGVPWTNVGAQAVVGAVGGTGVGLTVGGTVTGTGTGTVAGTCGVTIGVGTNVRRAVDASRTGTGTASTADTTDPGGVLVVVVAGDGEGVVAAAAPEAPEVDGGLAGVGSSTLRTPAGGGGFDNDSTT